VSAMRAAADNAGMAVLKLLTKALLTALAE
jgi:hypothetical protein